MMTESEFERAKAFGAADQEDERVRRASAIVREDFARTSSPGVLRLREHSLYRADFRLEDFVSVAREIFGG